ncbi:MAG: DNA repair protein RadC [Actinobacteria bacterium]|nr:MAG: DNA repair protein RadC [Actinomycetota bacterium]RIK04257.1 MAG: DNA repair protein [Acidobacteriota bacterium]
MTALPEHDRPRERLLARGAGALSDQELLAIVLRSGTRGASATDMAASLLRDHGGLRGLATARPEELAAKAGVGLAKATALVAAFELGRRADQPDEGIVIRSADDVVTVARRELDDQRRERVLVLVCDSGNRLRRSVIVSEGSVDRSSVPVREVLNAVLRHDGRSFAIAHNHPGGDPTPSRADLLATESLRQAASVTGLRFLVHVVLGGSDWRLS